jgi:hypothetical protein
MHKPRAEWSSLAARLSRQPDENVAIVHCPDQLPIPFFSQLDLKQPCKS